MWLDEILLSSDKTVAIIDGSGVLADPHGLDREELIRLAKKRVPVANFDTSKLSKDGYLVRVEDQDLKLPCKSGYMRPIDIFTDDISQLARLSWTEPTSGTPLTSGSRPTSSFLAVVVQRLSTSPTSPLSSSVRTSSMCELMTSTRAAPISRGGTSVSSWEILQAKL